MSNETNSIGTSLINFLTGGTTSTSQAPTTTDPFALDSQSSSQQSVQFQSLSVNAPTLPNPAALSLIEYARIVNTALDDLKEQVNISDSSQMLLNIQMWLENAAWARSLAALRNSMVALINKETSVHKSQLTDSLTLNKSITAFNTIINALNPAVAAMHNLQLQFAANQISAATYNAAVDQWNNLVPARNAQIQTVYNDYAAKAASYNLGVGERNAKITEINTTRQLLGITDLLPLEQPVVIAPIQLLPLLSHNSVIPAIPIALSTKSPVGTTGGVSTTISVTPTTPAEQAFLDSISNNLNAIQSGPGNAYNQFLISTDPQVEVMKQAITDYQNGVISTGTFNSILTNYIIFATGANNQLTSLGGDYIDAIKDYNDTIDGLNAQIDVFNETRISLGQEPIPLQEAIDVPNINSALLVVTIPFGPPPPTTNPLDNSPTVVLPPAPVGSKTPTSVKSFLTRFYTPLFNTSLTALTAYSKNLDLSDDYRAYLLFTLAGGPSNILPNNAFVDVHPQVKFNPQSEGPSISGVALTAMIVGLSSQTLTSTIANSIFSAVNNQVDSRLPQGVFDNALLLALSSLQEVSLLSGLPSLSTLSHNIDTLYKGSPAVSTALAINNLTGISSLIESGAIEKAITQYLTDAGVSVADIATVLKPLTSAVIIGLLQFGLFSAANALNLPGLLLQVLGNLSDADVHQLLVSASGKGFGDVLNDPVSVLALKAGLVKELVAKTGIKEDEAKVQIQNAINKTLAERDAIRTDAEFREAVQRNLREAGISEEVTIDLTDQASEFVKTDLLVQDINTGFVKDSLIASSITHSQQLNDAIKGVLENNDLQTKRQLHDAIVAELQKENNIVPSTTVTPAVTPAVTPVVTPEQANNLANQVVLALQSQALKDSFSAERIDKDLLIKSLAAANNLPGVTQAVSVTLTANPTSDFQFRDLLAANLRAQGIADADLLAAQSAVAVRGNQPLTSPVPGDFLTRDQLAEQLSNEIIKHLGESVNPGLAADLAKQLTLAIIGPASSNEIVSDEIRRPHSALNLLTSAFEELRKSDANTYGVAVTQNFKDTLKPTTELFMLAARLNDPGTQLFLAASSVFTAKFGKQKGYIDIAA